MNRDYLPLKNGSDVSWQTQGRKRESRKMKMRRNMEDMEIRRQMIITVNRVHSLNTVIC